jgi:hypothetical protein
VNIADTDLEASQLWLALSHEMPFCSEMRQISRLLAVSFAVLCLPRSRGSSLNLTWTVCWARMRSGSSRSE